MIPRTITDPILNNIGKGKIILIFGPRQVGKTTLARQIMKKHENDHLWLNGDEPDIRSLLTGATSSVLKTLSGQKPIVVIDEAQQIKNIGMTLKLFHDTFPEKQLIVTGSSAFDLANEIQEPLTGRKYEYHLFPVSFKEMVETHGLIEEKRRLEHRLIFGYYPEVVKARGDEMDILMSLSGSYLYKDVLTWGKLKRPRLLEKLLQALALQIGSEVKYHEVGQIIGADPKTVENYIDILEKAFVVFRVHSLSRNMRNEIKKGKKIYFYDNGIRNAVLKNFSPLSMRQDVGGLWENFLITERMKKNHYTRTYVNIFFWRNHAQQEIDYIEEAQGNFSAFEFKWNVKKKAFFSQTFLNAYPGTRTRVIHPDNFIDFIME
ncbi:MAG: ATP-binding protein [Desulfotignum sp.]